MPTKTTKTAAAGAKAPRKPRTVKKKEPAKEKEVVVAAAAVAETPVIAVKPHLSKDKYIFSTGRRKTSIANVRLFSGEGESVVNKKPLKDYFGYSFYREEALKPFQLTGLASDFHFTANVSGGGPHSQAQALRHGISMALAGLSDDIRKVLKKNGFLTRDPREKERKKPGLKRARRSPQWAKR